ncbi:integral membrane protein, partial [Streptomyces sp. C]
MILAAEKGDITTIIGGIAPNWGPFGSLGNEAKVMIEVVMAVAILLCLRHRHLGRRQAAHRRDRPARH